ncbi:MAG: hypothetical protein ACREOH_19115 [Candidatus Entotheonellia bacterium]
MSLNVREIAEEFCLSEECLTQEGLKAFLLQQLRLLESERRARCAKFGVSTLEEMDDLLKRGIVTEEEILDDFQNVDYLTTRIERIQKLLRDS